MSSQIAQPMVPQQDPFQNQFTRPQQLTPQQRAVLDPNYPVPERFPSIGAQPSIGAPIDVQPKKKGLFRRG